MTRPNGSISLRQQVEVDVVPDIVQFDGDGKGIDFEVMLRPLSGLQALGEEIGKRLAPYRALLKGEKSDDC